MNTKKNYYRMAFLIIFLLANAAMVNGQEKLLTLEDITYQNPAIFPARVHQLQWIGTTDDYAYVKKQAVYKVSAKRGTQTLLFDLDMLNKEMHRNGDDSLKRLPSVSFHQEKSCWFTLENTYYTYDFNAFELKKINILPDTAENIAYNPLTGFAAFTIKNNLYYAINGEIKQITSDDDPALVNGQTVHRNEFGISKGIFWSPSGGKLAFYRKDQSIVTDYPLVNIDTRIATVESTKYPMAGMTSEEVTLGVYDLASHSIVYMKTGEPKDQYLTSVTWGPDGKYIYIALLNRDQNHLKLIQYDAATGNFVRTLFEESGTKYVEPEHPLYFNPNQKDQFIWFSEKDGYHHLYLYNTNGDQIRQLTKGKWVVTDFLGFYGDNLAYFKATANGPLQNNVYVCNLKKETITRVTPNHGTHGAKISGNGKYILDYYSSTEITRAYKLLSNKGKVIRVLQEDTNPLADYHMGDMSIFTLEAEDGTKLYSRLIKPVDFDSTKKYPVIVYVYGGPHAQLISDSWLGGAQLFLYYLAQQGYVVFTLDNRGSANRGRDFEQAIFRQCGTVEMADQMVGVNYLKSLPYVDSTRIGVDGWSYGGFMTIALKLRHPGVFKVAVAGGPVIDWKYYEVMYGERYMDTPQTNPEGYKKANLLNYVDNLEGKLLIIHGTMDPTVVWQNSLVFLKEAIGKGKQLDYFVYPGHGHNVRGIDRAHLYEKITRYFQENL